MEANVPVYRKDFVIKTSIKMADSLISALTTELKSWLKHTQSKMVVTVLVTLSLYIKCCRLSCMCVCRTALILACEHSFREVVEVLLKHTADVTTVDLHGHDLCHYARLSGDQALIMMIKQAWDAASKGKSSNANNSLTIVKKSCTWQDLARIILF